MKYNDYRRKSRAVKVGNVTVGGDSPVSVQSMTNVPSGDLKANLGQVGRLRDAGCDIIRFSVPDDEAALVLEGIKNEYPEVPIVADIHFSARLAIRAVEAGADKIRINPGNIGGDEKVKAVAAACRAAGIPIRVGVNGGSLEKELLAKYGHPTARALFESAVKQIEALERCDFRDMIVAIKSSDVREVIAANRMLADYCDYPIHLGVTEAGGGAGAVVKASAAMGALLSEGIGDTVRVSLTEPPENEVAAARTILDSLNISETSINIISCPTCGRTKIDIITIADQLRQLTAHGFVPRHSLTVAVMGCAVNGPGEAREADFGIAGGDGEALLFEKGVIVGKIKEEMVVETLMKMIKERAL